MRGLGQAMVHMVDVSSKDIVQRSAIARGCIRLRRDTVERVLRGEVEKGDVFTISKLVAIEGAKKTFMLLPFCHPIAVDYVEPKIWVEDGERVCVEVVVKARERTGVEMEALTAVALALLNVWDMVKKYEKDEEGQYPYTAIEKIVVVSKQKLEAHSV